MAFAIMRIAKIKDKRGVTMALQHNTRDRMPDNANPEKTHLNSTYGGSTAESLNRFDEILPGKVRKNAVLAVEFVMTASPDFGSSPAHGNMRDYLSACDMWALKTFGIDLSKKDIRPAIHVAHHYDEKTPHTHILIMPIKDGKLNAKHYIGGSRNRMAELQEDFYQNVGKRFGLDRGKPAAETRAKHTRHNMDDLDAREKKLSQAEKNNQADAELLAKRFEENINLNAELVAKLKANQDISAELEKKEKALADLQRQVAEGNGAINQILRTGFSKHWTQEFQKRVIDYAIKNFPKYFTECEEAVSRNADKKPTITQGIKPQGTHW